MTYNGSNYEEIEVDPRADWDDSMRAATSTPHATITRYRVSMPGGRWKRGFETLADAIAYEAGKRSRDGVFRAIVAYQRKADGVL